MKNHINNQKGFTPIVIVLIVVVVGLACGAGYYVWQKNSNIKETEPKPELVASVTPAPTTSPTPTKSEVAHTTQEALDFVKNTYNKYFVSSQSNGVSDSIAGIKDALSPELYNKITYAYDHPTSPGGYDKVACAQIKGDVNSAATTLVSSNGTTATIKVNYSVDGTPINGGPPVTVITDLNNLKITTITCNI